MKGISRLLPLAAAALLFTAAAPGLAAAGGYGYGHGRHFYGHGHHFRHHYYPRHRYHHHYGHRPHVGFSFHYVQTVAPPPVVVREYPSETITYDQPAPQTAPPAASGAPATCVMTREYQTEISVGGQVVPGYGQACLQPDGSWYRGPAVPAAY